MKDFVQSLAFFVAIDRYINGIPMLTTPVADATALANVLEKLHGFETEILADKEANLAGLRAFLSQLPARIGPDDRVVFYFAGHGIALPSNDGPRGFIFPQDARKDEKAEESFLPMTELDDTLSALRCRHMLVILDCCFAGAFRWASYRNFALAPENLHKERYEWFVHDAAWQAIASAAHDQKALDVASEQPLGKRDDAEQHSPFAEALIRGLKGAADRAAVGGMGDGVITATELYLYLEDELLPQEYDRRRQRPIFWPLKKHDKGQFVFLVPGRELNLPAAPPLTAKADPWRGLEPYDRGHEKLFFGRGKAAEELAEKVRKERFVVVTGPSGIGKSSLVKAGLLPRLKDEPFTPILVRPGRNPFSNLAGVIKETFPLDLNTPNEAALRGNKQALVNWIASLPGQHQILLVIDQAEELITMSADKVSNDYLTLVSNALDENKDHFRVLFTLRSEFDPQFSESALKRRWLPHAHYTVPPMTQDELRRVIEGPAAVKVMRFDPGELVDQLVNEVVQMPGALPLLSFALSQMYGNYLKRHGEDRAITFADYEALKGGVAGALQVRANEIVDGVDEVHRATARRVLERFVSVESGEYARRRVPRREFRVEGIFEQIRVNDLLERLDKARLVVSDDIEGEAHLELAHDALILGWERLLTWIKDDISLIVDLRHLTLDAEKWATQPHQRAGFLWSDPARLDSVKKLQAKPSPGLNRIELAFASKSTQQASTVRSAWRAVAAVLVLATASATFFANDSNNRAKEALVGQLNSEASGIKLSRERAILAIESLKIKETPEATQLLSQSLNSLNRAVSRYLVPGIKHSVSKNGQYISSWDKSNKSVNIWTIDKHGYKKIWTANLADINTEITDLQSVVSSNGAYAAIMVYDYTSGHMSLLIFEMDQMGRGKIVAREPFFQESNKGDKYELQFTFSADDNYFLGRATQFTSGTSRKDTVVFFAIGSQVERLPLIVSSFGDKREIIDFSLSDNFQHLAILVVDEQVVFEPSEEEDFPSEAEQRNKPKKNEPKVTALVLNFPELTVAWKRDLDSSTISLGFSHGGRHLITTTKDDIGIIGDWATEQSQHYPDAITASLDLPRPHGALDTFETKDGFILRGSNYAWIFRGGAQSLEWVGTILNPGKILNEGQVHADRSDRIQSISIQDRDEVIITADLGGYVTFYEPYRTYGSRILDIKNALTTQPTEISVDHIAVDFNGLYEVRNWDRIRPDIRKAGPNNVRMGRMDFLAVSADGEKAAYLFGNTIEIILVRNGKELNRLAVDSREGIFPNQVAFSPNGKEFAAIVSDWIGVWDLTKGKDIKPSATLNTRPNMTPSWGNAISFDRSGNFLVAASKDLITVVNNWKSGRFQLVTSWQAQDDQPYRFLIIHQLAISAGDAYLAAVVQAYRYDSSGNDYDDHYVKIWRKWKRNMPEEINTLPVSSSSSKMTFHPRESVLAISDERELQVIGVAEKKPWIRVPAELMDFKFSGDGQTIVASAFGRYAYWRWRPRDLIAEACKSMLLPAFSPADWKEYIGLHHYTGTPCRKL